jgi:nitrogen regulatory protein PII
VDIRKLKVQQFIQLFTCEQDAQQVIEWIKELQQNAQIGDPITKITKFEDVAKVRKLIKMHNNILGV